MEVIRKEKTLAGLFLKYVILFCVNTILLIAGVFLLLQCTSVFGLVLPANYAEVQLTENAAQIRTSGTSVERWIPGGCTYGIYNAEGTWLTGSFSDQERKAAWMQYEKGGIYAENRGYYRFIYQDDGNICIVKYRLLMRYSNEQLNAFLPAPEVMMMLLDIILFILNVILLSRSFAKKLKVQLRELRAITEKIAGNDLEFETASSEIKEINEVMISLGRMKDALKDSLKVQWDMEKQRQDQLAALTHDVKTPLTIIRGNAELLEEGNLSEENQECVAYILKNVNEIEQYLEIMKQVLCDTKQKTDEQALGCGALAEVFREMAEQLAAAEKVPVSFDIRPLKGEICCDEARILRAWSNIISNAAEHTDAHSGMDIFIWQEYREKRRYLVARVRDYGAGFSVKDLQSADQEFYSGDASRHDRSHQGLGLAIAKRFLEEQGGFLEYRNSSSGVGAEVSLWLKQ